MGSPIQQQSLRRKVLYAVLIVALFCAMLTMRRLRAYGIDTQAQKLDIAEENLGQVELTVEKGALGEFPRPRRSQR